MHGGDIYNNKIEYDFSVNINPYGPYESVIKAVKESINDINCYPEYRSGRLTKKVADHFGIIGENVCMTNGASEAFLTIIMALCPKKIIFEVPSFSGYEYAANILDNVKTEHLFKDDLYRIDDDRITDGTVIFIANPSNPTGQYTALDKIKNLYKKVRNKNAFLIVDECFLPLCDYKEDSLIKVVADDPKEYSNLIVVRSFTKSFAIPGIRLGYFICTNKGFMNKAVNRHPEWNVSVIATAAGLACLDEADRLIGDQEKIKAQRKWLSEKLRQLSIKTYPTDACYILFSAPKSLYEKMIDKGILLRDCSDYNGIEGIHRELVHDENERKVSTVYRVAVKRENENKILIEALKDVLSKE